MELLKLLGILIVVIGFVLKLDSILIIMIAAIVTALVAGMDPVTFLETLGSTRRSSDLQLLSWKHLDQASSLTAVCACL